MFLPLLILSGVLGINADVVKTISLKEGDSVTLNLDSTETQAFNRIQWRFGDKGSVIAQMLGNESSYTSDEIFRDRLELDNQTGSLTIKNMRIKHSGVYKAEINHANVSSNRLFIVTFYETPSDAAEAEMKSLSVMEGDSATLQTDVAELFGDELMVWRFGDEGKLIAKRDAETNSSSFFDNDKRFRYRLELDETGSLTIKNMRNSDSGLYIVKISSNKETLYKKFSVAVSVTVLGLSSGSIAGIVAAFLLLVAVSAIGACCCCCKICDLQWRTYKRKSVTVKEGDDVTLRSDAYIQDYDDFMWTFGGTRIAEIRDKARETFGGPDGRFTDRLMLDEETGSLTIRNIRCEHVGHYLLKVKSMCGWSFKIGFHVLAKDDEETISVMEGDDVTLNVGTELNKDVYIKWLFEGTFTHSPLAEISRETGKIVLYDENVDGRFRDRLKLDHQTGSLTIKNTSSEDSGFYEIRTENCKTIRNSSRMLSVNERKISVEEGQNVTLEINSEIHNDVQILWIFGVEETLVAQIKGGTREIYDDDAGGRFRDRLKLEESGSLTINNISTEHTGAYKAQIISCEKTSFKKFKVEIPAKFVPVQKGGDVTLQTDCKIQADDQIQWMFGRKNSIIAEMKGESGEITMYEDVLTGRFRGRLMLDVNTGSLTVTNITTNLSGIYTMKINRSAEKSKTKSFNVFATVGMISAEEEINDSAGKQEIESATVDMQLLTEETPNGVTDKKGRSPVY